MSNPITRVNLSIITAPDGRQVLGTAEQADAIEALAVLRKGGIGVVHGYVPASNWAVRPVQDITFISRFSTAKLYERKIDALKNIQFGDVASHIASEPKLKALSVERAMEIFEQRREMEISSMERTIIDKDRSDAHRQGHDRCYIQFGDGIKVNLVTEKNPSDGLKYPVLTNGVPRIASIMVSALFLQTRTVTEGKRKVVNSGAPVLMSNAIARVLNSRSVGLKMLSLKDDNFASMKIQKREFLPEDVKNIPSDILLG